MTTQHSVFSSVLGINSLILCTVVPLATQGGTRRVILIARFDIHDKTTKTTTSTHCQGRCDCSMRQRTKFGKSLTSLNDMSFTGTVYMYASSALFLQTW